MSSCEGGPARRSGATEALSALIKSDWTLFAVINPGLSQFDGEPHYELLLASTSDQGQLAVSLTFGEEGLQSVWRGCGPGTLQAQLRRGQTPEFLLPPPTS